MLILVVSEYKLQSVNIFSSIFKFSDHTRTAKSGSQIITALPRDEPPQTWFGTTQTTPSVMIRAHYFPRLVGFVKFLTTYPCHSCK